MLWRKIDFRFALQIQTYKTLWIRYVTMSCTCHDSTEVSSIPLRLPIFKFEGGKKKNNDEASVTHQITWHTDIQKDSVSVATHIAWRRRMKPNVNKINKHTSGVYSCLHFIKIYLTSKPCGCQKGKVLGLALGRLLTLHHIDLASLVACGNYCIVLVQYMHILHA